MDEWKTDKQSKCFIEACPHTKEAPKAVVNIQYDVWRVLVQLTREVKTEWQAFLVGTEGPDGAIEIDGYWIPKQEVTGSTVENLDIVDAEVVRAKRLVASIHSHAEMAVFHSSTDIESTCKSQWIKHHITINNKLETCAKSQLALACGRIGFIDCEVMVAGMPQAPTIEGVGNITKKVWGGGYETEGWRAGLPATRDVVSASDKEAAEEIRAWRKRADTEDVRVSPLHRFNRRDAEHSTGKGLSHV